MSRSRNSESTYTEADIQLTIPDLDSYLGNAFEVPMELQRDMTSLE
jgi:hypothetical protein